MLFATNPAVIFFLIKNFPAADGLIRLAAQQ